MTRRILGADVLDQTDHHHHQEKAIKNGAVIDSMLAKIAAHLQPEVNFRPVNIIPTKISGVERTLLIIDPLDAELLGLPNIIWGGSPDNCLKLFCYLIRFLIPESKVKKFTEGTKDVPIIRRCVRPCLEVMERLHPGVKFAKNFFLERWGEEDEQIIVGFQCPKCFEISGLPTNDKIFHSLGEAIDYIRPILKNYCI